MRVVNVVAKFLVKPQPTSWVWYIGNGDVKIFGVDDATSALLQTEFQELLVTSPAAASSSSGSSNVLSTSYGGDAIQLDEALERITSYLNALDQQEFTVVSAFKDDLPALPEDTAGHYKMYIWTLQK